MLFWILLPCSLPQFASPSNNANRPFCTPIKMLSVPVQLHPSHGNLQPSYSLAFPLPPKWLSMHCPAPITKILFNGKPSLDAHCQQRYVETIVNNSITASEGSGHYYASPANVFPDALLTTKPYCFVADTDSFPFVIKTGANRFIVNDRSLFTSFKPQ
jgi:hypothetical protein